MGNLIKKVQNTAFSNHFWEKGDRILIGVSGGPDSVCLLDILAKISQKYNLEIHIAHINYGLRGADSNKDEKFVDDLANKYQFGLSVLKTRKIEKGKATEEKLRNVRYEFFEKIRKELGYDFIAVAHNLDDQVETFLMRIIRGSGLQGLSGMKYKNGKVIRPLLEISRNEILGYLRVNKLKYRTDKTNKTNVFFRNKVRNKLIPLLEKNFNPNIKKTIFDSVSNINEDYSLISEIAGKIFKKNLKVSQIVKIHPAMQKRFILEMIKNTKGNLKNIESSHVKEILKIIQSAKSKNQTFVFQGLKLARKGDKLSLEKLTNNHKSALK